MFKIMLNFPPELLEYAEKTKSDIDNDPNLLSSHNFYEMTREE